jgi:DNA-binding response OmpR family regulator
MKTRKILLVDDDLKNSMFLKRFLEESSYEVTYANNGKIAWELFPSDKPDLVLLDINMPEMDGFELAQKIREIDKKVILFFLTDRTEKSDRLKGFNLKGNDYIPKPFYPEELIAKIKERFEGLTDYEDGIYKLGNTTFNYSLCSIEHNGIAQNMSVRQADILKILAEHLNSIVERDYILDNVWGDNSYSNSLSLNVQITYLRKLLETDSLISIDLPDRLNRDFQGIFSPPRRIAVHRLRQVPDAQIRGCNTVPYGLFPIVTLSGFSGQIHYKNLLIVKQSLLPVEIPIITGIRVI